MITVTRTPRGVRVEGADKYEAISSELLEQIKAGDSPIMTYEDGFLNISDDFGNVYVYQLDPRPVIKGPVTFYNMERQL